MTRDERMKLIEPYLDRVMAVHRTIQGILSDLDAGKLPDAVFEFGMDVSGLYDLIGQAAKRMSQAADKLKDAALRKDD